MQEHISNSCPLSQVDCLFKQYGCTQLVSRMPYLDIGSSIFGEVISNGMHIVFPVAKLYSVFGEKENGKCAQIMQYPESRKKGMKIHCFKDCILL